MNLSEFLLAIDKTCVPQLTDGEAKTVREYFNTTLKNNMVELDIVKKWHDLLMRYVEDKRAVFFVRKYASASNKQWNLIRRGFETKLSDDFRYVYCDNYFAHYFFVMAISNFVPEYEDFVKTMSKRHFPYGLRDTSEERPYQSYPKGKNPHINTNGWKLAHIYSVNQRDYTIDYSSISKDIFIRGDAEDWSGIGDTGKPIRNMSIELSDVERNVFGAHFLRLTHPINYFLVPSRAHSTKDIGENTSLISYVRKWLYNEAGDMLNDFECRVFANKSKYSHEESGDSVLDVKYGLGLYPKNAISKQPSEKKIVKFGFTSKGITSNQTETHDARVVKIGALVRSSFANLISDNKITPDLIVQLLDDSYSKKTFGIGHSFLRKHKDGLLDNRGYPRYYVNEYVICGSTYFLHKEWVKRHRELFVKWINKITNNY